MKKKPRDAPAATPELAKCPTGIRGLDRITQGGLPRGRPTLVCGGAGSGKTLFGIEFLVRGATEYDEPGVFLAFEERTADLAENTKSLGFDLKGLVARKKLCIERVAVNSVEIVEAGEYNLDALFIRLAAAIESVRAKRVVLDTIETLFAALANIGILRRELHRLFEWLKDKGVTAVVTGERGDGTLTRHGLEEYISDCVIQLDQRVTDQIATRRMRIVKYRGSAHGTNEYPFLIDERGFMVLPITAIALDYRASTEFVSTGIPQLDTLLGGKGYFRGSTVMVSGEAGSGKTSVGAHFIDAACRRGERGLYLSFEESPAQIERNMRSIGIDLEKWVKRGLLRFSAARPGTLGLELHISLMVKLIDEFRPAVVVADTVSSFETAGTVLDARSMVMRLIDHLKSRQVTALFASLTPGGETAQRTTIGVSSLVDTWMLVRNLEQNGERTRGLSIIKSRGMKHSNQIREFFLTDHGIKLEEIYIGPDGVVIGSARLAQEMNDRAAATDAREDIEQKKALLARKRTALKARIAELEAEFATEAQDVGRTIARGEMRQRATVSGRSGLAAQRRQGAAAELLPGNGRAR